MGRLNRFPIGAPLGGAKNCKTLYFRAPVGAQNPPRVELQFGCIMFSLHFGLHLDLVDNVQYVGIDLVDNVHYAGPHTVHIVHIVGKAACRILLKEAHPECEIN